ncbi:hypothetical protein TNCV_4220781 [Trichonephila clavipes]|nr:hypothetical protein TNCV_4220781 [Trichonephila clavipes]
MDKILKAYLRLLREASITHDNTGLCMEEEGIRCKLWFAKSPDLNTIQHMWGSLGRVIACRQPTSWTPHVLKLLLQEEW